MKTLKIIATIIAIILVIDFTFFIIWGMSGQLPVDNFYIGSITTHILRAILF